MTMQAAEQGRVLDAVAQGPQLTLEHDWRVVRTADSWRVVTDDLSRLLPQTQVVAAGAAAQEVVVAVEASGHRVHVRAFPAELPHTVAVVQVLGPGPARRAQQLLRAAAEPGVPREVQPAELAHLSLAAEAFGCELLWQDDTHPHAGLQRVHARDVTRPLSTVVTRGDEPADWFAAGRALAACALVASDLQLAVQLGPHALGRRQTREEVRDAWGLQGWPQAQLTVQVRDDLLA